MQKMPNKWDVWDFYLTLAVEILTFVGMRYLIFLATCFVFPISLFPIVHANPLEVPLPTAVSSVEKRALADAPGSEMTPAGVDVRGVYMPVGKVKTWSAAKMLRELKDMGANAVILDVKDDMGRVTFTASLPHATGSPHGYQKKLPALIKKLKEHNIYVIARLVCFKDNWFASKHGTHAMRDGRDGKRWDDIGGIKWVDPHSQLVRDHIVSIAKASEEIGFDEVQLDYVRFPVDKEARFARYPKKRGAIERYEVIATLLKQVDEVLSIPLSIDVFGLTAYHPEESEALGQYLEYLAPHIDAISPMVYLANWPQKYWEKPKPERTHAVIRGACKKIKERLGKNIVVRPLLQGFRWRAENWGYGFVVNQIEAAANGGAQGYIFWNAGGRYRVVSTVWNDMDKEENIEDQSVVTQRESQ